MNMQAAVPFNVIHRSWVLDMRADRAHLRFCRLNLKCARKALALANQKNCAEAKASAFKQYNQAKSYLRQACQDMQYTLRKKPVLH